MGTILPTMGPIGGAIGATTGITFFGCWFGRAAVVDYRGLLGKIRAARRMIDLCGEHEVIRRDMRPLAVGM